MNLVDSSGWIEYLQDTPRADLFAEPIEDRHHLLVPTIALFEVHRVLSRSLPADLVNQCLDVMRLGRVLDLTDERAIAASTIASRHRLAMADAHVQPGARVRGHFLDARRGLPGVGRRALLPQTLCLSLSSARLLGCLPGQQHGVAIAEKSVFVGNGMAVQIHDVLVASEGAHQHHQA